MVSNRSTSRWLPLTQYRTRRSVLAHHWQPTCMSALRCGVHTMWKTTLSDSVFSHDALLFLLERRLTQACTGLQCGQLSLFHMYLHKWRWTTQSEIGSLDHMEPTHCRASSMIALWRHGLFSVLKWTTGHAPLKQDNHWVPVRDSLSPLSGEVWFVRHIQSFDNQIEIISIR